MAVAQSSGTESKEREAVKAAYPHSTKWATKVSRMSDQQVTAVYLRFKSQGKV
jgi:hypothetical protein